MFGKGGNVVASALALAGGFAAVTFPLVIVLHLAQNGSLAEAIDGVLSGAWFALCFGCGVAMGAFRGLGVASAVGRSLRLGLLAGIAGWAVLAVAWGLVVGLVSGSSSWGPAFAVNSLFFALWGWAWSAGARARREDVQVLGEMA